jgi:hypothetical protein
MNKLAHFLHKKSEAIVASCISQTIKQQQMFDFDTFSQSVYSLFQLPQLLKVVKSNRK